MGGVAMRFLSSRLLKRAIQLLGLGAGLLLVSLSSFAQGNAGRIVGAITDQSGGAIAGATVTVTDVQRGVSRALTTDDSGSFNAPNLTPGTYKVRGEFKGFKATERDNILLETGGEVRLIQQSAVVGAHRVWQLLHLLEFHHVRR